MSTFIVRVQLAHETTRNYALLSEMLLKAGFTNRIKKENGIEYWLPTGNYLIDTPDGSAKAWVSQAVVNVALSVDCSVGTMVLITEAKEKRTFWTGLQQC